MKNLLLLIGFALALLKNSHSQQLIIQQSFENELNAWSYICNPVPFTNTDACWNTITTEIVLTSLPSSGNHFFGIKDLNSPSGTADWGVLHFQEVNISGYQSVYLQFNYECIGYDTGDDIKYQLKLNSYLQPEVLLVDGYNNLSISNLCSIPIHDSVETLEFFVSIKQNGTTDYAGLDDFKLIGSENLLLDEPSNYPANLHLTNCSPTSIELAWEENTGFCPASAYLLIISTSAINTLPIDHIPQSNDLNYLDGYGIINLPAGTAAYSFTGLTPSVEYHIMLIPYSNSGLDINYKTDSDPPYLIAGTFTLSSLFLSEISDPADLTSARFVEIHNASDFDLNFVSGNWNLCKQTNGSTWACVALNGNIQSNKSYVVAYNLTGYQTAYHSQPNQTSSSVVTGNGNDAYFLYYGGNYLTGQLVDQYGTLNTDGLGSNWDYTDSKSVRKLTTASGSSTFSATQWRIQSANTTDCHPGFYGTIFTGNANEYWSDSLNWENGAPLPSSTAWVENSSAHFPVISQSTTIRSLILEDEIELIGQQLLAVSDKTFIGAKIPSYTLETDRWFLLAAPVSGMSLGNSGFTTGNYDFYSWNEAENSWHNQKNPLHAAEFAEFQPGKGYLVAYDTSQTRYFQGDLIQSDIQLNNLTKSNAGWHLAGNPFPHPILWASNAWNLNNISPFAYKLNASGNFYDLLFPGDIIPSRQGFWIRATQPNASLTIPAVNSGKYIAENTEYQQTIEVQFLLQTENCLKLYFQFDDASDANFAETEDAAFLSPLDNKIPHIYLLDNENNKLVFSKFPLTYPCLIPFTIENNSSEELSVDVILKNLPDTLDWYVSKKLSSQTIFPSRDKKLTCKLNPQVKEEYFLHLIHLIINDEEKHDTTALVEINTQIIPIQLLSNEQITNYQIITETGQILWLGASQPIRIEVSSGIYFLAVQTSHRKIIKKIIL